MHTIVIHFHWQDFSTPSLKGENDEKKEDDEDDAQLSQYQIVLRREWEQKCVIFTGFMYIKIN